MCLIQSNIRGLEKYNWEGDIIIHDSTVPSSRPVVGFPATKKYEYEIDVREFLVTEHNSLMQKTLREDIAGYLKEMAGGNLDLFQSRKEDAYDYRAHIIASFVAEKIAYDKKDGGDPWQFPDETLHVKKGDCEDRAFLIASLLIASGISSYNVRVALGKVLMTKNKKTNEYDHAWVMYKNEKGQWSLIEPLKINNRVKERKASNKKDSPRRSDVFQFSNATAEYQPYFVFNDSHLWSLVRKGDTPKFQDSISVRRKWSKFKPTFAGEVHKSILNAALAGADQRVINTLNRYFSRAVFGIVGPLVDDIDRRSYNPLDHFDNCFIDDGWNLVKERLQVFKQSNIQNLDYFALAAHGIADFYAHSSYCHFAAIFQEQNEKNDYAELYDHANPSFGGPPDYTSDCGFDLANEKFTVNEIYWNLKKRTRDQIPPVWNGKLISGRYAQSKDTWKSIIGQITEGPTRIPQQYLIQPDFYKRGAVPHHNEIAVDEETMAGSHKLYSQTTEGRDDIMCFANQFRWRKNSAIRHIRNAFKENWNASKLNLVSIT